MHRSEKSLEVFETKIGWEKISYVNFYLLSQKPENRQICTFPLDGHLFGPSGDMHIYILMKVCLFY